MRFDKNKPDRDLSKLDESFVDLRLNNDSIEPSSSKKNLETKVSTQQEVQEEVREPTRCIMRRNHPESQIIQIQPNTYLALQSAHPLFSGNLRSPSSICTFRVKNVMRRKAENETNLKHKHIQ